MKLAHSVCLPCRFAAKGRQTCPHCGKPMADMGRDFKAPRKLDAKAWEAVEALVARGMKGIMGHSARSGPRTANQVERRVGTVDQVAERRWIRPEAMRILRPKRGKG